ncbi:hypothetical protein BLOT_006064 [Blomia tropicalis]|nr:hypothetical protein BLOT_006064 [Blomia tropicalis]
MKRKYWLHCNVFFNSMHFDLFTIWIDVTESIDDKVLNVCFILLSIYGSIGRVHITALWDNLNNANSTLCIHP